MDDKVYKKKFKMVGVGGKDLSVYAENYSNTMEVFSVAKTRNLNTRIGKEYDFLVGKTSVYNRDWYGFETQEELYELATLGMRDVQMARDIQRYAHKAYVQEKEKYSRTTLSVAGGGVNVPLLLSGSPECMYSRKKAPVKSKIINMGINVEITSEVGHGSYEHAGMLIAQLISKLEKAGYRIRLNTVDAYYACGNRINVLSITLKRENEPMNYSRMLYPLTSVSSSRGLGFGWAARNPDFNHSIGCYSEEAFEHDEREQKASEMFENATGLKGFTLFAVKDIVRMFKRDGDERTMRYIESRLLASVN